MLPSPHPLSILVSSRDSPSGDKFSVILCLIDLALSFFADARTSRAIIVSFVVDR